jgi:hypothetical protein
MNETLDNYMSFGTSSHCLRQAWEQVEESEEGQEDKESVTYSKITWQSQEMFQRDCGVKAREGSGKLWSQY